MPAAPSPYTDDDLREDGTPDEVGRVLTQFGGHDDAASSSPSGKIEEDIGMSMRDWHNAVERMMQQMDLFDQPSLNINFINISDYEPGKGPWADRYGRAARTTVDANEALMADATHRLRMLLKENERGRWETNLRRGRLNTKALGQRAPVGDDRVFRKKTQPGKRDYFIHLGMDTSGSTCRKIEGGVLLDSMKAATGAMATMLSRLGIAFSVTAHSGDESSLELFHVKKDREPWGPHQQEALAKLQPYSANVDGHTLEYYRKLVQRRQETDRIILYFTDGAMPMSNYDEELEILQREIEMCKQLGIHLVGIGCGTDSPKDHGLDTIRMDGLEDIGYVVDELKKRILQHAGQQV